FGGKPRFVNAIIDGIVDALVECLNFFSHFAGLIIARTSTHIVKSTVQHTDNLRRLIIDDALPLFMPEYGNGHPSGVIRCISGVYLVQKTGVEVWVGNDAWHWCKTPAALAHKGVDHRNTDGVFQSF